MFCKKKAITPHLIVTVEQLFKSKEGHIPRLGQMIREQCHGGYFRKLVKRINIDEAHFIYTAGQPHFGSPAFRPAWGQLEELKRHMPADVRWHLFSATFPKHILSFVQSSLLGTDFTHIHLTSNRPNIIYTTHVVDGSLDKGENYNCFLTSPFSLNKQPHVLIFVENTTHACVIQNYLDRQLPPEHQRKGVVAYYHSKMSALYLQTVHNDFVSPTERCRILVSTSGQSVVSILLICNCL